MSWKKKKKSKEPCSFLPLVLYTCRLLPAPGLPQYPQATWVITVIHRPAQSPMMSSCSTVFLSMVTLSSVIFFHLLGDCWISIDPQVAETRSFSAHHHIFRMTLWWADSKYLLNDWTNELNLALIKVTQMVKNLPATWETWVWSLGQNDPLEKQMATHSSLLAWRIPWTEEPGRLQSMGWQRVTLGHNWVTKPPPFNAEWNAQQRSHRWVSLD